MAVVSSEECRDAYNVAVLPEGATTHLELESQSALINLSELPKSIKTNSGLEAQLNCKGHINLKMEKENVYAPRIVVIDVEKGKETPITNDETDGTTEPEELLAGAVCLQIRAKFMQVLVSHSIVLPKFSFRERVHDLPNNRMRKYKRSTSFNSRRVVILFSFLSSIGTMILIYLTLKMKQISDGSVYT